MKDGLSLLLLCVVIVAGVAIWLVDSDLVHPLRSSNGFVRQEPAQSPPQASSQAKAKPAPKPARARIPQMSAVIEPAATRNVSTDAPIVAGGELPSGAQTETNAKTYGNPVLSITRVDRGHDLDKLVYTRDRGKEVTIISYEDGKVSSTSSQSSGRPAMEPPGPRAQEPAAALLPVPVSIAAIPLAETPKTLSKVFDKTPAEIPAAAKPAEPVQARKGTCGEYRNGKLTVKPCAEVPLSPSEWLAKGSGAIVDESVPAGNRR